jgi:SAM-dependent methyltransferase
LPQVDYEAITVRDPNRVKRMVQGHRLDDAVALYRDLRGDRSNLRVLDFGAGDGELLLRISRVDPSARLTCYEPTDTLRDLAAKKLSTTGASIVANLHEADHGAFDAVLCCEVFEHLPRTETEEVSSAIRTMLAPGGFLICGVPNEIRAVGVAKALFRMVRRYGERDATLPVAWQAARARGSETRQVRELEGRPFIYEHAGFDYRGLIASLRGLLAVERVVGSPAAKLPLWLNSEVYIVGRRAGT